MQQIFVFLVNQLWYQTFHRESQYYYEVIILYVILFSYYLIITYNNIDNDFHTLINTQIINSITLFLFISLQFLNNFATIL